MIQTTVLPNHLKVATFAIPQMASVSIGIWVRAGSRYEPGKLNGVSHFVEHMVFKGSKKRSSRKIRSDIEGTGGSLNGFTAEECTCYLAKTVKGKFSLAFDVLSEMILHPLLRERDIEREKLVVREEIRRQQDLPPRHVACLLDELLWPNDRLGRGILGTEKTVTGLRRGDLVGYLQRRYRPGEIVVAVAGGVEHQRVTEQAERIFKRRPGQGRGQMQGQGKRGRKTLKVVEKEMEQTHISLGARAFRRGHPRRYELALLNLILGGNMSSRLFEALRERKGLAYDVGSYLRKFWDTGCLVISAGVKNEKVPEAVRLILVEMERLKDKEVSRRELAEAKQFCRGQLLLALEESLNLMTWVGESLLCLGKVRRMEEMLKGIARVEAAGIREVAERIFGEGRLHLAAIGPPGTAQVMEKCIRG